MPTESAFLLAGLLFVAAALGYVFARFGDEPDEDRATVPLEYLRGLKYLLKEQPDQAVEAFTRASDLAGETIETHFALGQLFRRRGEIERAIRIHRDLIERPALNRDQQEDARFALAEDYLSAGLFDRAEALLNELKDSPRYRVEALRQLIRLSELTREWERAIELHVEIERTQKGAVPAVAIAHYWCELAEQARREKDLQRAGELLRSAEATRQETVRIALLRGGLAEDAGDALTAITNYERAATKEPALVVDVVPRLWTAAQSAGETTRFSDFLRELLRQDARSTLPIALAAVLDPALDDPVAMECLWQLVSTDVTLRILIDADALGAGPADVRRHALGRIRSGLGEVARRERSYRCIDCGYTSLTLQWQCPGCRSWDTVRPRVRLGFATGDR